MVPVHLDEIAAHLGEVRRLAAQAPLMYGIFGCVVFLVLCVSSSSLVQGERWGHVSSPAGKRTCPVAPACGMVR